MRAVVVYESMFGNTRKVAEAIGAGLRSFGNVEVAPVGAVTPKLLADVDLPVVGGPTHAWDLSRPPTRQSAVATAHKLETAG
jgi:menaquinone-dependent protoporphyrinogen IX oxidase